VTNTVTINLILNGTRTINTGAGHNINYGASTVASVISGSGFGLIKDGTGNLTFRASTNTFTGNFTINAGVAQIGTGSAATDVLIGNSSVSGALGAGSVINSRGRQWQRSCHPELQQHHQRQHRPHDQPRGRKWKQNDPNGQRRWPDRDRHDQQRVSRFEAPG
jgi:autotransporter-associated beta strand protein